MCNKAYTKNPYKRRNPELTRRKREVPDKVGAPLKGKGKVLSDIVRLSWLLIPGAWLIIYFVDKKLSRM